MRTLLSIASGDLPTSTPTDLFLVQLVIIVGMCKAMSFLFKRIKQPSVIAEVVTGIILGPSALSRIPNFATYVFPATSFGVIKVIADVGLLLYMFIVGLELEAKIFRANIRSSIAISLTAMALPFGLGAAASVLIYEKFIDKEAVSFGNFLLFIGIALAITAFPVLARIITEYQMLTSTVGVTAMSSAAVDDVMAWIILAIVVAVARSIDAIDALYTFLMLIGFLAVMFGFTHQLLKMIHKWTYKKGTISPFMVIFLFCLILFSGWITDIIGVHSVFGGFIVGIITPRDNDLARKLTERMEDVVVILLLPLYFTFSGLRTDLGSLDTGTAWGCLILITLAACIGKLGGGTLAARLLKHDWRESFTIGILMNTKGLVELIVLNIGLDVGVLNERVFTIFVVMALITTCMTSPMVEFVWLRYQRRVRKGRNDGKFYLNLYARDSETGASLTTVAKLLVSGEADYKVKALHIKEISERPSSYFFVLNQLTTPEELLVAEDRAKSLELSPIKFKTLVGMDVSSSLLKHVQSHLPDMVLLDWDARGKLEEPGTVLLNTLDNVNDCSVAVLADKGLEKVPAIKKISIAFLGFEHESALLYLAKQLAERGSSIQVRIFATNNSIQFLQGIPNTVITEHAQPYVAATETSVDDTDLIIVGMEPKAIQTGEKQLIELVERSPVSVLLLKASNESSASGSSNKSATHNNNEIELPIV